MRTAAAARTAIPATANLRSASLDHFRQLVDQCVQQKVSRIVVCDTNGGVKPRRSHATLSRALTRDYPAAKFGFHGHTDRGLGVANTRAAILAGAVQVQGTLIGTGERCGNVNLTTVVGAMQLRGEAEFVSPESLTGLTGLAHSAYAAFGARGAARHAHRRRRRIRHLGRHARHRASAKIPARISGAIPRKVGASPTIGVNAQSGKANIVLLSEPLGVPLNSAQAQALMDANQAMIEGGGFTASEVSFRLACMRTLGTLRNWFSVKSWRVFDESDEIGGRFVQAFMTLVVGDATVRHARGEGAGPVDALTKAHAPRAGQVVPGAGADAPRHLYCRGARHQSARFGCARPRYGQLQRRRPRAVDHRRREQRLEPGRTDGHRRWLPLLDADEIERILPRHKMLPLKRASRLRIAPAELTPSVPSSLEPRTACDHLLTALLKNLPHTWERFNG